MLLECSSTVECGTTSRFLPSFITCHIPAPFSRSGKDGVHTTRRQIIYPRRNQLVTCGDG